MLKFTKLVGCIALLFAIACLAAYSDEGTVAVYGRFSIAKGYSATDLAIKLINQSTFQRYPIIFNNADSEVMIVPLPPGKYKFDVAGYLFAKDDKGNDISNIKNRTFFNEEFTIAEGEYLYIGDYSGYFGLPYGGTKLPMVTASNNYEITTDALFASGAISSSIKTRNLFEIGP